MRSRLRVSRRCWLRSRLRMSRRLCCFILIRASCSRLILCRLILSGLVLGCFILGGFVLGGLNLGRLVRCTRLLGRYHPLTAKLARASPLQRLPARPWFTDARSAWLVLAACTCWSAASLAAGVARVPLSL